MPRVPQPGDNFSAKRSFDLRRVVAFESKLAVALSFAVCAAIAAGLLAPWRGATVQPAAWEGQAARGVRSSPLTRGCR